MTRPDLTIAHMYPDLLRTYGDLGNVRTLYQRAAWRGFSTEIIAVRRGDPLPDADLIFIGGGADQAQGSVAEDLAGRREELRARTEAGAILVGVCAGYQLLGHSYTPLHGRAIEGAGLLDIVTVGAPGRLVGKVRATTDMDGSAMELVGFENHSGRTQLGASAIPLARVLSGAGNNGRDKSEGALCGNVIGTYLHGPVMPLNPRFADAVLTRAMLRTTEGEPLSPLEDGLEYEAHRAATPRRSLQRSGRRHSQPPAARI